MSGASDLERFLDYARAFELACLAEAWGPLGDRFAEDARHLVHGAAPLGADDRGRGAVIDGLRHSVASIDRRFDARIPEVLAGPCTRPDGVWMRYALTLRRAGLPELRFEGEHWTRFAGGRIREIEERVEAGAGERVAAYLAEHDAALRPAGAPFAPPSDPRDARELEAALLRTFARAYGAAKSEQDVGAALAVCSEGFTLETVALGLAARGREQAEPQLALFLRAFPDYGARVEGLATGPGVVTAWGRAHGTWRGELLGLAPTGRRFDLPFVSVFPATSGRLDGERFHFDLATLCAQIGAAPEALRQRLGRLASPDAA